MMVWTGLIAYRKEGPTSEGFGYWFGSLLLPCVIAYAIAGAKKCRNWAKFGLWFFGIGLVLTGVSGGRSLKSLTPAELLKEMSGTQAVTTSLSQEDKDLILQGRKLFEYERALKKSQIERNAALTPTVRKINSAQSFSSLDEMRGILATIPKVLEVDTQNLKEAKDQPTQLARIMAQGNVSKERQDEFLKGLTTSFDNSSVWPASDKALQAESKWLDATCDLYTYTLAHSTEYHVADNKLIFRNDKVRVEWDGKLQNEKALRKQFLDLSKRVKDLRGANLKAMGVTDSDLGLN
jgi:hypothetical protein